MNKKRILIKTIIIMLIVIIAFIVYKLSSNFNEFISIILVCLEGFLLATFFDITDLIHKNVENIKDNTNVENYKEQIELYKELLLYYSQCICSFLALCLKQEYKQYLKEPTSLENICECCDNMAKQHFEFDRIKIIEGWTFHPSAKDIIANAESNLNAIDKLLHFLPKELEYSRKIYPKYIDNLRGFYQLKNQLYNDSGSMASEAVMHGFLKDLLGFIKIST